MKGEPFKGITKIQRKVSKRRNPAGRTHSAGFAQAFPLVWVC